MAGLALLAAPFPAPAVGAFSTRFGGGSRPPYDGLNLGAGVGDDPDAVAANRESLAGELGVRRITFSTQVHGARVGTVAHREPGGPGVALPAECDGLVTTMPSVALGVLVADCVPVLLADVKAGVVAAAHAGRRGLVAGVLQQTVDAMTAAGSDPHDVVAVVGPAIGGCCYEVPAGMQAEVAAVVPSVSARTRAGTASLDLPRGAAEVLRRAGVATVTRLGGCTAEDERFYSHRRSGVTGRFAGVVLLR